MCEVGLDARHSEIVPCVFVQGFTDLVESEEAQDEGRRQQKQLATIPEELVSALSLCERQLPRSAQFLFCLAIHCVRWKCKCNHHQGHLNLENFHDRPVQAEIVSLLVLTKGDAEFATCVLIHGMGGTGKTVTAVAVLQEVSIRQHFVSIFWLTVGADAVDSRITQLQSDLHKQLTGKATASDEILAKGNNKWHEELVEAMVGKERALVVLDDPWMPEQVRLLNPIDSSQNEHRLLVTTRIRDLVPKAKCVELPLMGKDEGVALLLDLANVEEVSYIKDNPGSAWPPQAAYAIAAECGLLPITLTIAAQVVRSWGDGWGE